jgi:hypothetical protein
VYQGVWEGAVVSLGCQSQSEGATVLAAHMAMASVGKYLWTRTLAGRMEAIEIRISNEDEIAGNDALKEKA